MQYIVGLQVTTMWAVVCLKQVRMTSHTPTPCLQLADWLSPSLSAYYTSEQSLDLVPTISCYPAFLLSATRHALVDQVGKALC